MTSSPRGIILPTCSVPAHARGPPSYRLTTPLVPQSNLGLHTTHAKSTLHIAILPHVILRPHMLLSIFIRYHRRIALYTTHPSTTHTSPPVTILISFRSPAFVFFSRRTASLPFARIFISVAGTSLRATWQFPDPCSLTTRSSAARPIVTVALR